MNKRFASFLFTGKIAALPLFAQESLSALHDISSKPPTFIKMHETSAMESITGNQPKANEGYNVILLPDTIFESRIPKIMNLVITGLYYRDEVLIVISSEKDTAKLLETNPNLMPGLNDFVILNHFGITESSFLSKTDRYQGNSSSSERSVKAISLPVDLAAISQRTKDGSKRYLHIFVAGNAQWDKSVIRYSDVLELKPIDKSMLLSQYTEDCTVYSCP